MSRHADRWANGQFRPKYQRPPRKGSCMRHIHDSLKALSEAALRDAIDRMQHDALLRDRLNHPLFR